MNVQCRNVASFVNRAICIRLAFEFVFHRFKRRRKFFVYPDFRLPLTKRWQDGCVMGCDVLSVSSILSFSPALHSPFLSERQIEKLLKLLISNH